MCYVLLLRATAAAAVSYLESSREQLLLLLLLTLRAYGLLTATYGFVLLCCYWPLRLRFRDRLYSDCDLRREAEGGGETQQQR